MDNLIHKIVKNSIKSILLEEKEEEPKKKKEKSGGGEILTRGAFGSGGRAKSYVVSAKARAESDPEGLLQDLGITSAGGGSDLEKVQSILNGAIHSNDVMGAAYSGCALRNVKTPDGGTEKAVTVALGEIDRKNGVRFLAHTLTAAKNAGVLSLENSVQFAQGGNYPIVIYEV